MIPAFLLNILVDPASKMPLHLDVHGGELMEETTGQRYKIKKDVPILIIKKEQEDKPTTALHQQFNTAFSYIEHYNKDAEYFDYFEKEPAIVAVERKRNRAFIQSKIPKTAKQILDIGCGSAWVAAAFTKQDKYVVSLDVSETNPIKALEKYHNPYHAAVVADAKYLPFASESFDAIIAAEVIEHITAPKTFITEWLRVLKPGGSLILETPFDEKIVQHLCVHCNCPTPANAHLHSFNKENIQAHIPTSGIAVTTFTFNNKWMNKLRLNYLFQFLPFSAWKVLDAAANAITGKAESFVIRIVKDK